MSSSIVQQNLGNSSSNSIVVQSPNGSTATNSTPVAGTNARLMGNVRNNGIYYFNDPKHQVFTNIFSELPQDYDTRQAFIQEYAGGAVLIPFATHRALAEEFAKLPGSIQRGADRHRNPAGVMVPMEVWTRFTEAGRSPEWFQSATTELTSSSPRPARYSTGTAGHWAGYTTSLGARKKEYMQPEWEAAMKRKKEQESLAARKSGAHARMKEYHAIAARTSPFGFWHRWRAGHHSSKSRMYDRRKQQLGARALKLQIQQERAAIRGNAKDWRDASLMSGAGRGDGRLRSVFRTLRA